ncbi:MAG: M24 family metallopeptidase [Kiritimatiellae bacterium]|nr:M24 family metallopeptidase [Kiritimatiellia bacterium]
MQKTSTGARLVVAGSGDAANMRYACGFQPVDPVLLLHTARERHLVVPVLEVGRAREEAKGTRVYTPEELGLPLYDRRSIAAWAVQLLKRTRVRRVRVAEQFPLGVARALEESGVQVEIASAALYPEREVKGKREIEAIVVAQHAAAAAVRAAVADIRNAHIARSGELKLNRAVLSSERLRLTIDRTLLAHDCAARETIAACGRHAADPHHRGEGPLRVSETIVLDIFPQHRKTGYWGDITRTVVKGPATPKQLLMYRAVLKAQAQARARIKPGVRADLIHKEVQETLRAAGFRTEIVKGTPVGFFHGTGHSIGLDIHETPSISLAPVRLRAGHVVTVEPGLYYPEDGGVRIEDTVAVTARGARVLAACPYTFELK